MLRPHSPDPLDVPLTEQPRANPSFWVTDKLGVQEIQNPNYSAKQGHCPQHSDEQFNPYHATLVKHGYFYSHSTAVRHSPVWSEDKTAGYHVHHTYKFGGLLAGDELMFTDWVVTVVLHKLYSHRLGTAQPQHTITPSLLEQFLKRKVERWQLEIRKMTGG